MCKQNIFDVLSPGGSEEADHVLVGHAAPHELLPGHAAVIVGVHPLKYRPGPVPRRLLRQVRCQCYTHDTDD